MPSPGLIDLRLANAGQLFNTMDPSPFHERDLDHDAEEFIYGWARECDVSHPLRLRIVLRQTPESSVTHMVQASIRNYFAYRAEVTRRDRRELFREGRMALAIGVAFLGVTLALRSFLPAGQGWWEWVREGLTICGWVGLWKPIDILLYRWWPLRRQERLQSRLADCPIEVVFDPA